MARRFSVKKGINIKRVVGKLATTLITLYAGGYVITELGNVMNGTSSPFNPGLALIGWTVSGTTITSTTGSGILTVIGIIGVASIVLEFVQFRL